MQSLLPPMSSGMSQQDLTIMEYENMVFRAEIEELAEQNEVLMSENAEILETSHLHKQETIFLRQVSVDLERYHSRNTGLHEQLCAYENDLDKLHKEKEELVSQNAMCQERLELSYKKQASHKQVHNKAVAGLKSEVFSLKAECDALKVELHVMKLQQQCSARDSRRNNRKGLSSREISQPTSPLHGGVPEGWQWKYYESTRSSDQSGFASRASSRDSRYGTPIFAANDDMSDIVTQLGAFGYDESSIETAMASVKDKHDINEIVEMMEEQSEEIASLKAQNRKQHQKLKRLRNEMNEDKEATCQSCFLPNFWGFGL